MALLYRFVKLQDRAHSHVFTFVVTRSVTRDLERDVTSKEFTCGHQRWAITFSRTDKVLGVYLVWKSTSEYIRVYVDFSFTLLNREHFSVNESFTGKQVKFTAECPAQGNRNYISVNDLYARNFTDPNGEFQLELSMGHVRTVFDSEFRIPTSFLGHHLSHRGHHHHGGVQASTLTNIKTPAGVVTKVETSYFSFAGFDWNIALYPNGIKEAHGSNENRLAIYLNRCTGFDHQCRVRYSIILGDTENRLDSGIVDDVSDSEGKSYGWHPRGKYTDLVRKGVIKIHVELILANTLSEVVSNITFQPIPPNTGNQNVNHGVTATPVISQCYDRDKQGWSIKCDCHSESIRIHMVYKDIQNVPRNHLRYVSWTAYVLRFIGKAGPVEPVPLPGAPFSHYYAQDSSDEGIIMETDVAVKQLRDTNCPFLTEKNQIRVQIEWEDSYLLFQATYHKYDDVIRLHNQQMRKEIATLQAENYSLERQLFSYQKSIAFAHSRGTYSDDLTLEDGRPEDDEQYFEGGDYSLGDRSLSTDTEYA